MSIQASIGICMWKMGVQLKNRNSYVILLYTPERKLQMRFIEMNEDITNSIEAVSFLFGLTSPNRISITKPRPTLKEIFDTINPFHLFSSKHIPSRAILPKDYTNDICLCYQIQDDSLIIGLLSDNKVATASLKLDDKGINTVITLVGQVCLSYFYYGSVKEDLIASLKMLSDLVMAGDTSQPHHL
jgi:hypothetical protein